MQTAIKKILSDRKRFLSLLLLADEQETMIDKYIGRGDEICLSCITKMASRYVLQ